MVTMTSSAKEQKRGRLGDAHISDRWAQFALKLSIYAVDAAGILAILAVGVWLLFRQYPQLLTMAAIGVLVTVGAGLYPTFYRRGQSTVGVRIFLISFLLLLAISTPLMPELMLATIVGYTILFIRGNLLVGEKNHRWLTGACLFAFVADVLLVRSGAPNWPPVPDETIRLIGGASFGSLVLLATAIIMRMATLKQEEQFHESRLALETEKRAAAEREQYERLQTTVQKYAKHIEEVASGNLSARLTPDGNGCGPEDPMIVLGHRLNEMTASLQRLVAQTKERREDLRTTVDRYVAYMAEVTQDNPLVVPIIASGQFYGIAGMDLDLERLQELADEMNIYDGSGKLVLRSSNGTLVGVTGQPGLIGKGGRRI